MAADLGALARRLPTGLRARIDADADIARVVEFRNRWATPSEWTSAEAVRYGRRANPEPKRLGLLVEDTSGAVEAVGIASDGGMWAPPDGSWRITLLVAPEWRRRGIGRSLVERLEAHAWTNGAKRVIAAVRGNEPAGARFAEALAYRPFHERIDSYIDVPAFDASKFEDPDAVAARAGITLIALAEIRGAPETEDAFLRRLLPVMWDIARDVPSPTPMPPQPPPFEIARRMFFEGPDQDPASTIIAMNGDVPVGMTATVVKENGTAYTNFTGVSRAWRGKGLALAMKLRALRELKTRGIRLFGTTNDEQNAAMRGINSRLGYVPDAPTTMYEKKRVT